MVNSIASLGLMQETLFELYESPAVNDVELALKDALKRIELKALEFDGSDYTKRQLQEARNAIAEEIGLAYKDLFPSLQAESMTAATTVYNSYMGLLAIDKTVPKAVLDQVINSKEEILGYTFKELLDITQNDHERAIRVALASGVSEGLATSRIVKNIKDANTRNVKQLKSNVRTILKQARETSTYASYSEMEKYGFVEGYEFLATLDSRTSEVCRNADGRRFYQSIDKIDGRYKPPLHISCRSKLTQIIKDSPDIPFRSSIEGKVAKQSYGQWFGTQPESFQLSVLGRKKFDLYKQGRYKIGGLADIKDNSLNIENINKILSEQVE